MVDIQKCLPVLSLCRGEVSSSRSLPDTSSSATQVAAACLVPTTFPTGKKSALGRPFQKKLIRCFKRTSEKSALLPAGRKATSPSLIPVVGLHGDHKAQCRYLLFARFEFDLNRVFADEIFGGGIENRNGWYFPGRTSVRRGNVTHHNLQTNRAVGRSLTKFRQGDRAGICGTIAGCIQKIAE